jgi:hypothetical protein
MGAWLALVALSTMTTYQHQFLDLPTGAMAGLLTIALIPDGPMDRRGQRFRLATFYASGTVLMTAIACKIGGLGWILLWPAFATLVVAAIYAADRVPLYRSRAGEFALVDSRGSGGAGDRGRSLAGTGGGKV